MLKTYHLNISFLKLILNFRLSGLLTSNTYRRMNNFVHERTVYITMKKESLYNLTSTAQQQKEAVKTFKQFSHDIIRKRMAEKKRGLPDKKRKAFLDLLISSEGAGRLSVEDVQEEVDTFMFAGHGTATAVFTWAIYVLARNPAQQKLLHRELDEVFGGDVDCDVTREHLRELRYLDMVVREAMRLYPSDVFIGRRTDEECVIDGKVIPPDTDLTMNIYYIHRHPDVWEDPDKFDPERFSPESRQSATRSAFSYIPFSAGPRNCVGQRFAIQEEKVLLCKFFRRFAVSCRDREEELMINSEISFQLDQKLDIRVKRRRN